MLFCSLLIFPPSSSTSSTPSPTHSPSTPSPPSSPRPDAPWYDCLVSSRQCYIASSSPTFHALSTHPSPVPIHAVAPRLLAIWPPNVTFILSPHDGNLKGGHIGSFRVIGYAYEGEEDAPPPLFPCEVWKMENGGWRVSMYVWHACVGSWSAIKMRLLLSPTFHPIYADYAAHLSPLPIPLTNPIFHIPSPTPSSPSSPPSPSPSVIQRNKSKSIRYSLHNHEWFTRRAMQLGQFPTPDFEKRVVVGRMPKEKRRPVGRSSLGLEVIHTVLDGEVVGEGEGEDCWEEEQTSRSDAGLGVVLGSGSGLGLGLQLKEDGSPLDDEDDPCPSPSTTKTETSTIFTPSPASSSSLPTPSPPTPTACHSSPALRSAISTPGYGLKEEDPLKDLAVVKEEGEGRMVQKLLDDERREADSCGLVGLGFGLGLGLGLGIGVGSVGIEGGNGAMGFGGSVSASLPLLLILRGQFGVLSFCCRNCPQRAVRIMFRAHLSQDMDPSSQLTWNVHNPPQIELSHRHLLADVHQES
ncbi:hypothetical protein BT69DRAFT_599800 [Atractiella rhizophila]|nr:hypothetical protein BT69DRAFT_599800 [Atractiella rhizophila]